jgi:hypothetical protein
VLADLEAPADEVGKLRLSRSEFGPGGHPLILPEGSDNYDRLTSEHTERSPRVRHTSTCLADGRELDVAVQAATTHGALGARMTGGGFGGSAIALVPTSRTAEVISAVIQAFEGNGFGAPDCFAVSAGGPPGARP